MTTRCECRRSDHEPKLVVLTGGPGAGKTAVLEAVRRSFCRHIAVLPEAATILFSGGFPRRTTRAATASIQRAISHVQVELERMELDEREVAIALCDRGTLDGLAYVDAADGDALLDQLGTSREQELARYAAVIHLRTPPDGAGYNHRNPARIESAAEAAALDARIAAAWDGHPRRRFVENQPEFVGKLFAAVELIRDEVPACCRLHRLRDRDTRARGVP